jgi:hypothetical protein
MKPKSLLALFAAVAGFLAAGSLGASAEDASTPGRSNDVIRSRPVPAPTAVNAPRYRPSRGCFAAGRDTSGNLQMVCY